MTTTRAAARARGLAVSGMRRFTIEPDPGDPRLVLGFGNTSAESIDLGIQMLVDLL